MTSHSSHPNYTRLIVLGAVLVLLVAGNWIGVLGAPLFGAHGATRDGETTCGPEGPTVSISDGLLPRERRRTIRHEAYHAEQCRQGRWPRWFQTRWPTHMAKREIAAFCAEWPDEQVKQARTTVAEYRVSVLERVVDGYRPVRLVRTRTLQTIVLDSCPQDWTPVYGPRRQHALQPEDVPGYVPRR